MTKELKREYTLRITQANRTQLIVILYEIILTYLRDAVDEYNNGKVEDFKNNILYAQKCVEEMMLNLHYDYDLAKDLKQIYLYMKKSLRMAYYEESPERLISVMENIESLRNAYKEISIQDTSAPVMEHTQKVVAGLTYGKKSISENLSNESSNRGFRI